MKKLLYDLHPITLLLFLAITSCHTEEEEHLIVDRWIPVDIYVVDKEGNDLLDINSDKCILDAKNLPIVVEPEKKDTAMLAMTEDKHEILTKQSRAFVNEVIDPYLSTPGYFWTNWHISMSFTYRPNTRNFVIDLKNGEKHTVGFRLPSYDSDVIYTLDGKITKNPIVIVVDNE